MSKRNLEKCRNIGIMAHIDAGKTTVTERILYATGVLHEMGEVHEGEAATDWMEQEKERGITITAAAISCAWNDYDINIIDTPGHVDFTIEVERSLRVLDGAVAVFCAVGGVQPQTETVWRQANKHNVPRIAFVNKLDRIGANYFTVIGEIKEMLHGNPIAMHIPVGQSEEFIGMVDVLTNRFAEYSTKPDDISFEWKDVPAEYAEKREEMYDAIVEAAADFDESIADRYLEGGDISLNEIKLAIRKGVLDQLITPVFCGTALKNKGLQILLDAVVDYLPSPLEVPPVEGTNPDTEEVEKRTSKNTEPFSALAFKIMVDPFVGSLTFIRVYSGKLEAGSYVYNASKGKRERVSRMVRLHADKREEIKEVVAGDIAAVVGLKDVVTGDTLCDENHQILLESIYAPEPVVSVAVEPKNKGDYEKMSLALRKLMQEDPSFRFSFNEETGQTVIAGMGELHLEIMVDRLLREYKVESTIGKPQVAYKETVQKPVAAEGKFIRQSGGRGQFGHVRIRMNPLERGAGFEFSNEIVGGMIPKEYIPGIEKGLRESLNAGVIGGYPVVDLKVELYEGSYHDVDSSEMAFKIAASMAFKEAMAKASPVLLEPIMKVEVLTPEDNMGDVMGDLSSRRGRILGMHERKGTQVVDAEVPLSEMFGYATALRSMTQGRAGYSMEFSEYRETPKSVQEAVVSSKK